MPFSGGDWSSDNDPALLSGIVRLHTESRGNIGVSINMGSFAVAFGPRETSPSALPVDEESAPQFN